MNYRKIIASAVAIFGAVGSQAAAPFYAQTVEIIQDGDQVEAGNIRLKISISLDEEFYESSAVVGQITVCSESACYKPQTSWRNVSLYNTKDGKAEELIKIKIPNVAIKSIHFEPPPGQKAIAGDLTLSSPMKLPQEMSAADLVVFTKRRLLNNTVRYQPSETAWSPYGAERQTVFYNPRFDTAAKLSLGASIKIPKNATSAPQTFSIAVHDVGDKFPLVDIYPVVQFGMAATISAVDVRPYRVSPTGNSPRMLPGAPASTINKSINATGVIRIGALDSQSVDISGGTLAAAAATDSCVTALRNLALDITSSLASTGSTLVRVCENVPPYIHIAITNNSDPREILGLTYNFSGTGSYLSLQRLENWTFGSQITMNGFTWSGSSGVTTGTGLARGFVQDSATVLGSNRVDGGTVGSYDSNKLAFLVQPMIAPRWREGSVPPLWTTGLEGVTYPFTVVSSSTSIIKNGICSTSDATSNRWSAFGTTAGNRLIFVSSTSEGSTSASELCAAFQALDANFAIRLDGSTAAGMTVDGIRLNPITGANSLVYGSSRYIAYGLRVGYRNGTYPATTPVLAIKSVPTNPCLVDPRRCQ